jgi:hypothetical protein
MLVLAMEFSKSVPAPLYRGGRDKQEAGQMAGIVFLLKQGANAPCKRNRGHPIDLRPCLLRTRSYQDGMVQGNRIASDQLRSSWTLNYPAWTP